MEVSLKDAVMNRHSIRGFQAKPVPEEKLKEVNLKGEFPLWKKNTSELAIELIEKGFKTAVKLLKRLDFFPS